MKIKILCASAILAAAPFVVAEELSETGEFLDGVAAIVNTGVVLKGDFYAQVDLIKQRIVASGTNPPPDSVLEEQVLEQLISKEIQMQLAKRFGITDYIGDAAVNDAIGRIAAQQGISITEFPAFIETQGEGSYAEFRESIREELILQDLRMNVVLRNIDVSEREVEQCILDLESNVVVNSDWQLSHILLPLPEGASNTEIEEVQALADDIYARLQDNADFRELAIRYSKGPTALEGGSLGWMKGQQIPSIFTDILQDMKAGDFTAPFRTTSSFHLVRVDNLRSVVERSEIEQSNIRHILITPNEIIDDATAKQRLEEAREKILGGEDFGEQAKLLSDDPGSANQGGELGWSEVRDFAPEFAGAATDAEIGEITEPFRTQFGWHILQVQERRIYDNTEEMKERNCIVRIRSSKQEEETALWMQRIRDEAFVDKRI